MLNYENLYASRTSFKTYRPPNEVAYDFQVADPDPSHFPTEHIREAADRALSERGGQIAVYPDAMGDEKLRQIISDRTRILEDLSLPIDQIIVISGSTQGLCLMADTFIEPGDTVITEQYTYPGTLRAFNRCAPQIAGIPLDKDGIDTEKLAEVLEDLRKRKVHPKFIYTITNFQNPTGVIMSLKRRKELIRLAKDYDTPIFEDDVYGDLIYEGTPLPSIYSLAGGENIIKLGSFSKIIGAGMRIGWLVAAKQVIPKILTTKVDSGVNSFSMMVVAEYMEAHMHDRLEEMQGIYRSKRDAMLAALEDYLGSSAEWSSPHGGLFIWLKTPSKANSDKLLTKALEKGVNYYPGPKFSPIGEGREYLRLAYSHYSPNDIRRGVKLLAEAMNESFVA
ncbi:MAG: PLP-dependent aminotransferase family protein [Thaumarchaeota archaeon]|nr:PLP-dependent aminotransferase family protein [Nitrososphaerota archaeon]